MRQRDVALSGSWWLALVVPCILIALILGADLREGPKTAYVGVLTAVPLFAAIFGTPLMTAITAVITWSSALVFGLTSADGNVPAQTVRLVIIAVAGMVAVGASYVRQRREQQFQQAQRTANEAEFLRLQASHDDLTGLLNRRGFFEGAKDQTFGEGTIVVIDCDDFKDVNDQHGHQVGDEVLKGLAGRLASGVSRDDLVARWGGDEFLLLLRVPFAEGTSVARRVVDEATARPMSTSVGVIPVSLSAGVARFDPEQGLDQGIAGADRAMYAAKSAGAGQLLLDSST